MSGEHLLALLEQFASAVMRTTMAASMLVALILALQWTLRNRLSARARFALWFLLILRLVTPSAISVHMPTVAAQHYAAAASVPTSVDHGTLISASESKASPAPKKTTSRPIDWMGILAGVWFLGVFALIIRIAVASRRLSNIVRRLDKVNDPSLAQIIEDAIADLGLRRAPQVLAAPAGCGPALVGLLHPRLLIPKSCLELPARELRMVVLHELAHYRRRDVAVGWITAVLSAIHWFNPAVWFALARMRADRELACDELVLSVVAPAESNPQSYGLVLLKLAQSLSDRAPVPGAVGIVEGTRTLHRRISMIARYDGRKAAIVWTVPAVLLLASVGWLRAGDQPTTAPVSTPAARTNRPAAGTNELITVTAVDSHVPVPDPTDPAGETADLAAVAKLQHVIPHSHFEGQTLTECISFYRDVTGLNVTVNWPALGHAGVDAKAPIQLDLQGVTAERFLQLLLAEASPDNQVDYEISNGIVMISSVDNLNQSVETRVYDVADLLPAQNALNHDNTIEGTITSTVMPGTWKTNGGGIGSTAILGDKLVVTTTAAGQRKIAKLLAQLRHPIDKP